MFVKKGCSNCLTDSSQEEPSSCQYAITQGSYFTVIDPTRKGGTSELLAIVVILESLRSHLMSYMRFEYLLGAAANLEACAETPAA